MTSPTYQATVKCLRESTHLSDLDRLVAVRQDGEATVVQAAEGCRREHSVHTTLTTAGNLLRGDGYRVTPTYNTLSGLRLVSALRVAPPAGEEAPRETGT